MRARSRSRRTLVERGDDLRLPSAYHRAFAYMPFEHDETPESQREALRLFGKLKDETGVSSFYESAMEHAEVIERFGRFPHRNRILGARCWPKKRRGSRSTAGFDPDAPTFAAL